MGSGRSFPRGAALPAALLLPQLFVCGAALAGSQPDPAPRHPRKVRVGLYENKPKIHTSEAGTASRIFPAILDEIARREQWELTYVPCEWFACLEHLKNGSLDLMPDVARTPMRDDRFDFHTEEVAIARQGVLGADVHFIQKPFTQGNLAAKVREALGR